MNDVSPVISTPVAETYFVTLQKGIAGYEQYQGKIGLIRSVRADGFLEVDFSCSGSECCVYLDAYLMEECDPPQRGGTKSNQLTDQTATRLH